MIFITGGAGFIGSHMVEALSDAGHTVTVFDNLRSGKKSSLNNYKHVFVHGDIRDYQQLKNAMKDSEYVFHFAALTSVAESMTNIDDCISINLNGTLNVLNAAKETSVKKVIFASSAAVYGDDPVLPKKEDMRLDPKSPYAITKADGEYYCNLYQDSYGVPTVSTRFFNVFGERQDPHSSYAAAIPQFITKCITDQPISIYGDGTQTRDFIYVKDLVKALVLVMEKGTGVYNIGYGKVIDINSLVKMIKDYLNSDSKIQYMAERLGEIKHSYSSIEKLKSLGFIPDYSLEIGLQRTIEYFKKTNVVGKKCQK